MKVQDVKQSGTCGNTVSVNSRYGVVRRRRPIPSKRRTNDQVRVRTVLGGTPARWRNLTDEQRDAWRASGLNTPSHPSLGQSGPISGYALFVKINCALAAAGVPCLTLPPKPAKFRPNPVGKLTITNRNGEITLQLSVPTPAAELTIVRASPPCSVGRSVTCTYAIIGLLPPALDGLSDITDLYVKAFGKPPVSSRVFIRTRQVIDGWEDDPVQTTAIVPGP